MATSCNHRSSKEMLDLYFIENRARLLDIAAFLDRIDRYRGPEEARLLCSDDQWIPFRFVSQLHREGSGLPTGLAKYSAL